MTAPENPPKLWALTVRVGSPRFSELQTFAHPDPADAREQHACVEDKDQVSPVAEYVLASTAAAKREAAVKAAREKFATLIENADDLADDLMGRPRSSEVIEALRRERDALAAERDELKAHVLGMADRETWLEGRIERLTEALHEVVVLADVAPHETPDLRAIVKVSDDALAAGKGVG